MGDKKKKTISTKPVRINYTAPVDKTRVRNPKLQAWQNAVESDKRNRELEPVRLDFNNTRNFLSSYMSSPGFKQRLNNFLTRNPGVKVKVDPNRLFDANAFRYNPLRSSSYYRPSDNTLTLGNLDYSYRHSMYHEGGHALSNILKTTVNGAKRLYSDIYTNLFSRSAAYKQNKKLIESKGLDLDSSIVDSKKIMKDQDTYNKVHDGLPEESYADLIDFREMLLSNGIYDSMKANNKFTLEHLNRARKYAKDHYRIGSNRFLKNFKDSDIIEIMNTVAYNQPSDNQSLMPLYNSDVSYAKTGRKLIRRRKLL